MDAMRVLHQELEFKQKQIASLREQIASQWKGHLFPMEVRDEYLASHRDLKSTDIKLVRPNKINSVFIVTA